MIAAATEHGPDAAYGRTANLYTHLLPQVKQDAAERRDRLFAERS